MSLRQHPLIGSDDLGIFNRRDGVTHGRKLAGKDRAGATVCYLLTWMGARRRRLMVKREVVWNRNSELFLKL
jgi:hypothetical protein